MCVLILSATCQKYLLFWEELSDIWSKMYRGFHVEYQLFLSDCNEIWIFSTDFRKELKNVICAPPVPVATDFILRLFRAPRAGDKHRQQLTFWVLQYPIHDSIDMVTVSHMLSDVLVGVYIFLTALVSWGVGCILQCRGCLLT